MPEQNYANHTKWVPLFHFFLMPLIFLTLIGSLVNLYHSLGDHERIYNASLITALSVALFFAALLARIFALTAQDRAIRAEENMRHYLLAGRPLDTRLTVKQIVGLRFASDNEFVDLARKAAEGNLSSGEIKKSIKSWRPDHDRL
jgi:L-cystine uptake protein TcyP (sodium:dicarboxylate symporter family)